MAHVDSLAADTLTGIRAIAVFTGATERRTLYLLEGGRLPAGKVGNLWVASKARLRQLFDAITAGGRT